MLLGYNTNGFAHHRLEDAIEILAEIGYRGVAVTVERDLLDPPDRSGVRRAVARLRPLIAQSGLRVTIETGSRFILDPRRKHQPTLLSADPLGRARRIEFVKACVDLCGEIGGEVVSLWSGAVATPEAGDPNLSHRLVTGLRELSSYACDAGIRLGFEPEPGMYVDTMNKFAELHHALNDPRFGLTLDVGHVHCLNDGAVADHIRRWRGELWNVHIEDMYRGRHEHLPFGEGDMEFSGIHAALRDVHYDGPIHVELSRHSHDAVNMAIAAFDFLSHL